MASPLLLSRRGAPGAHQGARSGHCGRNSYHGVGAAVEVKRHSARISTVPIPAQLRNDLDFKEIVNLWPRGSRLVGQCSAQAKISAREFGMICVLLAAMPTLVGCESSRSQEDYQFQKQVTRAQECRQLQDKLVVDQPLTPERREEIVNTMEGTGCTARLP